MFQVVVCLRVHGSFQKGLQTGLSSVFTDGLICKSPLVEDGGEGVESLPDEYPQSDDDDEEEEWQEEEEGTLTVSGEILEVSMVLSFCPRWDMRRDPSATSTCVDARHLLTSVAQAV